MRLIVHLFATPIVRSVHIELSLWFCCCRSRKLKSYIIQPNIRSFSNVCVACICAFGKERKGTSGSERAYLPSLERRLNSIEKSDTCIVSSVCLCQPVSLHIGVNRKIMISMEIGILASQFCIPTIHEHNHVEYIVCRILE